MNSDCQKMCCDSPPEAISCWRTPGDGNQKHGGKLVWCFSCELCCGQLHFHLTQKLPIPVPVGKILKLHVSTQTTALDRIKTILRSERAFPTPSAHKGSDSPILSFLGSNRQVPWDKNIFPRMCQGLWVKRANSGRQN